MLWLGLVFDLFEHAVVWQYILIMNVQAIIADLLIPLTFIRNESNDGMVIDLPWNINTDLYYSHLILIIWKQLYTIAGHK